MLFCMNFVYTNVSDFKIKIDHSIMALRGEMRLDRLHLSSYALCSNALTTFDSFTRNPFLGSGLGSHYVSFKRYIGDFTHADKSATMLNAKDADSLFLRLVSETGLIGAFIVFIFIVKFYVFKRSDKSGYLWIISNAILAMIFIKLIRNGHYFYHGFFLFFWIYYFAKLKQQALITSNVLMSSGND